MAFHTLSICSGVGGLDLGVRIARPDARCVVFVEREISAASSLVASMEAGRLHSAPVWSDLRTFDAGAWRGAVDCVLSGDPCQGNSVAGKRLGADDDRWLLDRAIECFDQSGASTFFRENVTGNADGQLAVAIPALEGLGCRIAVGIFSAGEAGASHRRERLFILAHRADERHERSGRTWGRWAGPANGCVGVDDTTSSARGSHARWGRPEQAETDARGAVEAMADANGRIGGHGHLQRGGQQRFQSQGDGVGERDGSALVHPTRHGRGEGRAEHGLRSGRDAATDAGEPVADASGAELEGQQRGQHHPAGWQVKDGYSALRRRAGLPAFAPGPTDPRWPAIIERWPDLAPAKPRVRGMAHGMADRIERLRHCGNGVVPLAAALAWVRLHGLLADDTTGNAVRFADDQSACAGEPFLELEEYRALF